MLEKQPVNLGRPRCFRCLIMRTKGIDLYQLNGKINNIDKKVRFGRSGLGRSGLVDIFRR